MSARSPSRRLPRWPEIYAFFKFELLGVIDTRMNAEDIEEAILRLPPHELAKFRAWVCRFRGRAREGAKRERRAGSAALPAAPLPVSANACASPDRL